MEETQGYRISSAFRWKINYATEYPESQIRALRKE